MGLLQTLRGLAKAGRQEAGTAAIEFGLMAPLLVLLIVGTVEIGSSVYQGMRAQNAAEAGAVYASKYGFDAAGISAAVAKATSAGTGTSVGGPAAIPAPSQFCGCPAATGIATSNCASVCADGGAPGQYVQINTQIAHQPILSFSGLSAPVTITGQAIVRLF